MISNKYIGMDVHKESISFCVRNSVGKVVMESAIETKASTILQFIDGLRGDCDEIAPMTVFTLSDLCRFLSWESEELDERPHALFLAAGRKSLGS